MRIEVKDLCHVYSPGLPYETVALDGISFCCEPGEFVGLIGRTGSGKSTLLQHINGLLKPSSGTVLADGVDINEKSEEARALRRRIGLVFQYPEYQLFEESVIKDVCFGPKNQGLSEEDCKARAEKALRLVGLDPDVKGEASPFTLSGGEKRRAAIAGVLAMEPEVLILDEPTAGLDPKGRRDILMMIENVRKTQNITILLVSHSMDDVAALAERVLVIEKGRVLMNASAKEVFARGGELRAIGLSRPSASRLLDMLADRGVPVDRSIISKEDAEEEIMRVFKKWP